MTPDQELMIRRLRAMDLNTCNEAADLIDSMAQRNEPLMKLIEYADLADDTCYGTVSSRVVRNLANEALGIRQEDAA